MILCLGAVTKDSFHGERLWDEGLHDINQVELWVTNFGKFGQINYGPGCFWPKGSQQNYILGAGIWFGAIDARTGDTLVTIGYDPRSARTEFAPGLNGQDPNASYVKIYMYPNSWPAPLDKFPMAPQEPVSQQDSWCCYNDCDSAYHIPGDTRPIGIEAYQIVYGWYRPEVENTIFFTVEIKNVLGQDLQDCYIGICTDNDIGNRPHTNERSSGVVGQWYVIDGESLWVDNLGYQWQKESEPGWAGFPGAICYDLLQTPFDLEWGADKDSDSIPDQYERDSAYYWHNVPQHKWDVDSDGVPDWRDGSENPQLGMSAFKRFTPLLEPNIDKERYLTLAGYDYQSGQYQPYDTVPPPPDDQIFLMASGPFDLAPDSSVTCVFAIMFARWDTTDQRPDTALVIKDKWAQYYYDQYWFLYAGVKENSSVTKFKTNLIIWPNPVSSKGNILFTLSKPGPVSLKLYDAAGRMVKEVLRGHKNAGNHTFDLNTNELSQGTYFLLMETPHYNCSRSLLVLH